MLWEVDSFRSDPTAPAFLDDKPVSIFDDDWVLCSRTAQFVQRRDRTRSIRFAAAQAPLGRALCRHYGLNPAALQTELPLSAGGARFRSDAANGLPRLLGRPWWLGVLTLVPRPVRDLAYDLVARPRFSLFGRRQVCYLGEPGAEDRFLS